MNYDDIKNNQENASEKNNSGIGERVDQVEGIKNQYYYDFAGMPTDELPNKIDEFSRRVAEKKREILNKRDSKNNTKDMSKLRRTRFEGNNDR